MTFIFLITVIKTRKLQVISSISIIEHELICLGSNFTFFLYMNCLCKYKAQILCMNVIGNNIYHPLVHPVSTVTGHRIMKAYCNIIKE